MEKRTMKNIETVCPICASMKIVSVCDADYARWQRGTKIQEAFPYLDEDDLERVLTGICPLCWDSLFDLDGQEDEYYDLF
jgi:hypothetical protein